LVAVAAGALAGCQTIGGAPTQARLPAVLEPYFATCTPGDGAAAAQVFADGSLLGSAQGEWVAKAKDSWEAVIETPLGNTLLTVVRSGATLTTQGPLAQRLPQLAVGEAGFLEIEGVRSGLRADEVPCLLDFKLPAAWRPLLQEVEGKGSKIVAHFADAHRDIDLTAIRDRVGLGEVCAVVSWRRFLVFKSSVSYCLPGGRTKQAVLSGVGDYSLTWVRLDEQ